MKYPDCLFCDHEFIQMEVNVFYSQEDIDNEYTSGGIYDWEFGGINMRVKESRKIGTSVVYICRKCGATCEYYEMP